MLLDREIGEIFNSFLNDDMCVFLESQKSIENIGRYSIIASNPFLKMKSKNGKLELYENRKWVEVKTKPLDTLVNYLKKYKVKNHTKIPFVGGVLGYFSYDFFNEIYNLKLNQLDDINIPDMLLGFYNEAIVVDHKENYLYIVVQNFKQNPEQIIKNLEDKILKNIKINNVFFNENVEIKANITKKEYFDSIKIIKDRIECGDVYQINYTQRFECRLNKTPYTLFNRLRKTNSAPFATYMDFKNFQIISSSPERFIKITDNKISTRPIKGTIKRGKTINEDVINENILKNSEKDRSELLMIVDLERNDIGQICKIGSVKVDELFKIERYATVFQQVADISGDLKDNIDIKSILKSCFPGGSITGAPKLSAIKLIGELEKTTRNIYTGSIGYISFDGNMDFNIVIRTILCKNNKAYYQVGGGIVWDSEASSEYEESLIKGKALKEALEWKE